MQDIFNFTVTLFNFSEYDNKFFSTKLYNVECQRGFDIQRELNYHETSDRCLLLINYEIMLNTKTEPGGNVFLDPIDWRQSEHKSGTFTLQTDKDFFAIGEFSEEIESFESFKDLHPNITFLINDWNDFEDVVPHLEVYGAWGTDNLVKNSHSELYT